MEYIGAIAEPLEVEVVPSVRIHGQMTVQEVIDQLERQAKNLGGTENRG